MTHDRPTPAELVEAVREFLSEEILPTLDDRRLRFRTLVALNALSIAQRQLEDGDDTELDEVELAELARRIRSGDVPDGIHPLLRRHVEAKLRVSSPAYLARYE